jgi:rod shape determining protein RodA
MPKGLRRLVRKVDWWLIFATVPIMAAGLVTMHDFGGESSQAFRQLIWLTASLGVFFVASAASFRFLRRRATAVGLFSLTILALLGVILVGVTAGGAQSWYDLGPLRFQPSAPAKIVLIAVLAKYFSRRRLHMHRFRHVLVSGLYALVAFGLVLVQPDFGSALILLLIWFGMVFTAGISWKYVLSVVGIGALSFVLLWTFALADYQKERIQTFVNPAVDMQGAGYNANQSMIAAGSGQLLGKGVGQGTQSRLEFLPEDKTDFIFAAFAEEWGFVGVCLLFVLYGIVFCRVYRLARNGPTDFERLFGAGVFVYLLAHVTLHTGINVGLFPVTGTTMPFMSYGGSHLVTEFLSLGILVGMQDG